MGVGAEVDARRHTRERASGLEPQSTFGRLSFKLRLVLESVWRQRMVQRGQQCCQHVHSLFHFLFLKFKNNIKQKKALRNDKNF
jgi:hypothetical protein